MIELSNHTDDQLISTAIKQMVNYGQIFYRKGWNLATSSNYSAVISANPLRLIMTASGKHKGELTHSDFVVVDENLQTASVPGFANADSLKPSAEAALHVALAKIPGVKAVLHTHSVWSTILSKLYFEQGYIELCDFEMLKALPGVDSHETPVRIAILDNSQDIDALAREVTKRLHADKNQHAFLLKGHGLYTWAESLEQARNQIEALEFLFEVVGCSGDKH
jgi:methylthioribulose-1-phosphate dehydratase